MKTTFRIICVSLLVLCAAHLRAETITHNFGDMIPEAISFSKYSPSAIVNSVATTAELEYSCGTSGASFGMDKIYKSVIALNIPNKGEVIISPAIKDLIQVKIYYYAAASYNLENLEIKVSTDGALYGEPLIAEDLSVTYDSENDPKKAAINCIYDLPNGDYYIKLVNTSSEVSIFQIEYKTDPSSCACLQVVSQ